MRLSFLGMLILFFASCESPRYVYSPNAHNIPSFKKQGDTKLSGSFSANFDALSDEDQYSRNRSNGLDVQAAVAVTNHLALQSNYYSRWERSHQNDAYYAFDSTTVEVHREMIEGGLGYFTAIDRKQRNSFALYGGVGFGKMDLKDDGFDQNTSSRYHRFYQADLLKLYLEPSLTFRAGEVFTLSVATRFSSIRFKKINSNYSWNEKLNLKLDSLDRYSWYFFEPVIINSFGFKKAPGFRIEYQFGFSLLLSENDAFNYHPFNFSVGLVFDIPKLIRGAGKKE